jgi:prophage antirepressor-like protein
MTTIPVILFDYQDHYVRTIKDEQGEPWFVAADICSILEIKNPSDAIQKGLPEDERARKDLGHKVGEAWYISESGLYRLIFRSNKPEAENFRLWVFREVLPAIRKTGFYSRPNVPVPIVSAGDWPLALSQTREGERMVRELKIGMDVAKVVGLKNRRQMLEHANNTVMERTGVDCLDYFGINLDRLYLPNTGNEETIERFLAERCIEEKGIRTKSSVLYAAFYAWHNDCIDTGIPLSIVAFSKGLSARFHKLKSDSIWYCGIRLAEQEVAL